MIIRNHNKQVKHCEITGHDTNHSVYEFNSSVYGTRTHKAASIKMKQMFSEYCNQVKQNLQ